MVNPYDEALKDKDSKNLAENIKRISKNMYSHKPFYIRWHKFKKVSSFTSYVCQTISPIACFVVFFFLFNEQFEFLGLLGLLLSVVFAGLISVIIELVKRYSTKDALVDIFNYNKFGLGFVIAILCSVASIGTSFWGASTLPANMSNPPILEGAIVTDLTVLVSSQDAVNEQLKQGISEKKKEIKDYFKNNKSSRANRLSSRPGVKEGNDILTTQLHALQDKLSTLHTNNPTILKDARIANKAATEQQAENQIVLTDKHNLEMSDKGLILGYISLTLEGVFWCAMIFVSWYYKRAKMEFEGKTSQIVETDQPDNIVSLVKKKTVQQQAKDLRSKGLSFREIGSKMGVTHTSARRYCNA